MVGRPTSRLCLVLATAFLVALQAATPAWAWGRLGHRVISCLAEKQLTPATRAAIAHLLEPGESLAGASTWADEVRGRLRKTVPGIVRTSPWPSRTTTPNSRAMS
jgi:S1/P1 Nuclease